MYRSKTATKIQYIGAVGLAAAVFMGGTAYGAEPVFPQSHDPWFKAGQKRLKEALKNSPNLGPAKNVIVFIGDGMGVSSVTASRIFAGQLRGETGEENFLSWEKFPHAAFSKTFNTNQQTADSAGTATAWNSGVKAQAGMIGGDSTVKRGVCASLLKGIARTSIELAEMAGMSTGTVSTARLTHATPAASYSHSSDRDFEDDGKLAKAWKDPTGCKDIARQLIEFPFGDGIEVAMGGGRRHFIPKEMEDPEDAPKKGSRTDKRDLTKEWVKKYKKKDDGWVLDEDLAKEWVKKYKSKGSAYVWNQKQFDAIDPAKTNALLGLFNRSHMQYEANRVTKDKGGEPSLAEMTAKAIDILSKNPNGFYLQVEAGRIDHANHATSAYRMMHDTIAFSNAIEVALKKVDTRETLIIVTADHSHVLVISGYPTRGNPILGKVVYNSKQGGVSEGKPKLADDKLPWTTLGYYNGGSAIKGGPRPDITNVDTTDPTYLQQSLVPLRSETHAGEDVPLWAIGPGAWLFQGTIEQSYIFHVVDYVLSLRARAKRAM